MKQYRHTHRIWAALAHCDGDHLLGNLEFYYFIITGCTGKLAVLVGEQSWAVNILEEDVVSRWQTVLRPEAALPSL